LNFSRPAAPIIAQYFNFINLGFDGYRRIALNDMKNARLLSKALDASGYYHVVSEIHKAPGGGEVDKKDYDNVEAYAPGLPVVAFRFSDAFQQKYPHIQQVCQCGIDSRTSR
jgi:glutamate decarboxylase